MTMTNSDMDMEYSIGLMVLIMRDSGYITKPKDKVLSGMLKAMFIVVNLRTTWLMAMVSTLI